MTLSANTTNSWRISSIDLVRGLVMVIMALDHTRDFFHADASVFNPTDLTKTTPILFFTRWITHFCAPTFVLLAGVAVRISRERKTPKELALFLVTRGLWLVILELTIIRFSFFFNLTYDFTVLQVIWVIGWSMVVLATFVFLPEIITLATGLLIIVAHNSLDLIQIKPEEQGYVLWSILHQTGFFAIAEGKNIGAFYAFIPWLGIMLTGFGIGRWFTAKYSSEQRKKSLLLTGLSAVGLFIAIRWTNLYGDPAEWSGQKDFLYTIMSFLNCEKYPPSLLYTLMTLGPVLVLLALLEGKEISFSKPLIIFGRVPLFYYVIHFYLIHASSLLLYMIYTGTSLSKVKFGFNDGFGGIPFGYGYSLPWVYVAWMCLLLVLYPLCNWYNKYKSTHKAAWLSYL